MKRKLSGADSHCEFPAGDRFIRQNLEFTTPDEAGNCLYGSSVYNRRMRNFEFVKVALQISFTYIFKQSPTALY